MSFKFCALLVVLAAINGCASTPLPASAGHAQAATVRPHAPMSRAVVRRASSPPGGPGRPATPAFEYAYVPPQSPGLQQIHVRVRDADLLRRLPEVQAIDGMFSLPRRLRYVTAECGEFGAFYRPADAEVVLCYETLRTLYERGQAHQRALGL